MSIQSLRSLVNERLTAAAEEIFGVFERTITRYQQEIDRQQKLLDVLKPEIKLHKLDSLPPQLLVCEEEVHPEQQERSPSLLQGLEQTDIIELTLCPVSVKCQHDGEKIQSSQLRQTQDPELLRIKEEQEELFQDLEEADGSKMTLHTVTYENDGENTQFSQLSRNQDPELLQIKEELLQGLEEADGSKITVFPVKCEDGQENALPFQPLQIQREKNRGAYSLPSTSTEQMKTEPDGEDCGVSEPASNLDPAGDLEPTRDGQLLSSDCSGTETDDGDEWDWGVDSLQLVCEEEVPPEQQERSPSLDQEEPELLQIKEEQEELWTSQEEEQLQGLEEADIIKRTSTPVPVKSEHDEEKPQSSWFNQTQTEENREAEPLASTSTEQMKTEPDGEDCGVSEPASNLDPAGGLEPTRDGQLLSSDCSGTETNDSDDWEESGEPQSGLKKLKSKKTQKRQSLPNSRTGFSKKGDLKGHIRDPTGEKPFSCSVCGIGISRKADLKRHMTIHTGEKPFSCSVCGKGFSRKGVIQTHMRTHTEEKPFSCSVCGKTFSLKGNVKTHMRSHTGEKPFSCSVCGKGLSMKTHLLIHMRSHTGEKPFSCSVCGKGFTQKGHLRIHMRCHTGEKPFSCSFCGKTFTQKGTLQKHMRRHTGDKSFRCSVCGKAFCEKGNLKTHTRSHTGDKPFSCSVCGKGFCRKTHLQRHNRIHTG